MALQRAHPPARPSASAANPPAARLISSRRVNPIFCPGFQPAARPLSYNLSQRTHTGGWVVVVGGDVCLQGVHNHAQATAAVANSEMHSKGFEPQKKASAAAKLLSQQQEAGELAENRKMKSQSG